MKDELVSRAARRAKRKGRTRSVVVIVIVLVVLGLGAGGYFLTSGLVKPDLTLELAVDDALELSVGANVYRRGMDIGTVTAIKSTDRKILITLRMDQAKPACSLV